VFGITVQLERLTGYSNPVFEHVVQSVVRTNPHGIATPTFLFLMSSNASGNETDYRGFAAATGNSFVITTTESASLINWTGTAPGALGSVRFAVPPGNYYDGSARLEIKYGSTWFPVVGRSIPRTTTPWRISNGQVRLTSADGGTSGTLEVFNGSAWESQNVCHVLGSFANSYPIGQSGPAGSATSLTVLRSSPEQVTVRIAQSSRDWTYSIQAGAFHATATFTGLVAEQNGVSFTATNACTAITAGIRRTSNDANGNRLIFATPTAFTSDLVNGSIWPTAAATTSTMMLGVEYNGSSATANETAADVVGHFMAQPAIRRRVIVR
jgi:hypothetical protein